MWNCVLVTNMMTQCIKNLRIGIGPITMKFVPPLCNIHVTNNAIIGYCSSQCRAGPEETRLVRRTSKLWKPGGTLQPGLFGIWIPGLCLANCHCFDSVGARLYWNPGRTYSSLRTGSAGSYTVWQRPLTAFLGSDRTGSSSWTHCLHSTQRTLWAGNSFCIINILCDTFHSDYLHPECRIGRTWAHCKISGDIFHGSVQAPRNFHMSKIQPSKPK